MWGLPNGQMLNILMLTLGLAALILNIYRSRRSFPDETSAMLRESGSIAWRKAALVSICAATLVIPSDATRDIPASYGSRHPDLEHSWMYPQITDALAAAEREKEGRP